MTLPPAGTKVAATDTSHEAKAARYRDLAAAALALAEVADLDSVQARQRACAERWLALASSEERLGRKPPRTGREGASAEVGPAAIGDLD